MHPAISGETIAHFRAPLEHHPVYAAVEDIEDLRCFMQHHVYSVWDFMSLIKSLQAVVAPARTPWIPAEDGEVQRFINELVLEEESDVNGVDGGHSSHFALYLRAMEEVGADTSPIRGFVARVAADGIDAALAAPGIPEPSRRFTRQTFAFIDPERPHLAAAALALGREHIIPCMFRSILGRIRVDRAQAPIFHDYLDRHIHLDEDFHAPLSLRLLNRLCGDRAERLREATAAAETAVHARVALWDGVHQAIRGDRTD